MDPYSYGMSNNSFPIFTVYSLYNNGQDFLDKLGQAFITQESQTVSVKSQKKVPPLVARPLRRMEGNW